MKQDNQFITKEIAIGLPHSHLSINGTLTLPVGAKGLVIFAHGSGSSRFSPRNQFVASILHDNAIGTLLLDLLTEEEDKVDNVTREHRFNIPLLAQRLELASVWAKNERETEALNLGFFGASTGSAAALIAASKEGDRIKAVVSRGGRTDLADEHLSGVKSAVLFLVGGLDTGVIELNQGSFELLQCKKELIIIPGATHLFEEEGKLENVARLAVKWFSKYLK